MLDYEDTATWESMTPEQRRKLLDWLENQQSLALEPGRLVTEAHLFDSSRNVVARVGIEISEDQTRWTMVGYSEKQLK